MVKWGGLSREVPLRKRFDRFRFSFRFSVTVHLCMLYKSVKFCDILVIPAGIMSFWFQPGNCGTSRFSLVFTGVDVAQSKLCAMFLGVV